MRKVSHATAHLFISDPYAEKLARRGDWINRLFSTHPPTEARIRALLGRDS
jgi:Zn-dependent protease with chaperone function